jgi:hypothetical protein
MQNSNFGNDGWVGIVYGQGAETKKPTLFKGGLRGRKLSLSALFLQLRRGKSDNLF